GAVRVQKFVLAHGLKRRLVAFELALKVSFVARRSLAFADSRVFCPHRGVIGLVDQAQQERAEAVGFALWRFDAVTAQPADKEQDRHLESSVPRVGVKRAGLAFAGLGDPALNAVGVWKWFWGPRLRSVGEKGTRQAKP